MTSTAGGGSVRASAARSGSAASACTGEPGAFEGVRRRDVGERQELVADRLGKRLADIEPARVADHRIAEIERVGPRRLHRRDERGDGVRLRRRGEIAGDDSGDARAARPS